MIVGDGDDEVAHKIRAAIAPQNAVCCVLFAKNVIPSIHFRRKDSGVLAGIGLREECVCIPRVGIVFDFGRDLFRNTVRKCVGLVGREQFPQLQSQGRRVKRGPVDQKSSAKGDCYTQNNDDRGFHTLLLPPFKTRPHKEADYLLLYHYI